MGRQTRGAECKALAAGAGSSSGNSLIDGSGAPPAVTGLKAGASSVTGLSAGSFLVPKEASAPDFAAGMPFLRAPLMAPAAGRLSFDQKTAENTALA